MPRPSAAPRPRSVSLIGRRSRTRVRPANRDIAPDKALRARRKFLRIFPQGFRDDTYLDWERNYKWAAHQRWEAALGEQNFASLIAKKRFAEIAALAVQIEARTNLLFSFEKMALRDAVRSPADAKAFSSGLFEFLHGPGPMEVRFTNWISCVGRLPRRQTRILTWPVVTVFGFLAEPRTHFFVKPRVTQEAARRYGRELPYTPRPSWTSYKGLLDFVRAVRADIGDLRPRDMIDMQSFLWVQGSDEYPD
jgi:hypothetical protein